MPEYKFQDLNKDSGGEVEYKNKKIGVYKEKSSQIGLRTRLLVGVPGGIRTPDLKVRSLAFYPAKLQALEECLLTLFLLY